MTPQESKDHYEKVFVRGEVEPKSTARKFDIAPFRDSFFRILVIGLLFYTLTYAVKTYNIAVEINNKPCYVAGETKSKV